MVLQDSRNSHYSLGNEEHKVRTVPKYFSTAFFFFFFNDVFFFFGQESFFISFCKICILSNFYFSANIWHCFFVLFHLFFWHYTSLLWFSKLLFVSILFLFFRLNIWVLRERAWIKSIRQMMVRAYILHHFLQFFLSQIFL